MELIFILTYNCNYRCRYCDIDKRYEDIDPMVLEASLKFLEKYDFNIKKTKFFGGEPTLLFDKILYIIQHFPKKYHSGFYLTTNGSLLSNEKITAIENNNIIATISIDGDSATTDQNRLLAGGGKSKYQEILDNISGHESLFRVNQVITPGNVGNMAKNFLYLYNLGFREFNFLPEFYVEWSKSSLKLLAQGFENIKKLLEYKDIYIVNSENYSPTSFFNFGIVIDTDGSIYGTNLILAGRFEKYKPNLLLGSVHDTDFILLNHGEQKEYLEKIDFFLQKEYSQNILKSVYYINRILTKFTLGYDNK